jgi:hypothetical protein
MTTYVLATADRDELETTVFSSESGDVVAVFTQESKARQYLKDAGWQDDMTVAELTSIDLMEWLIKCHRNGVQLIATDPDRAEQESGVRIDTLTIKDQLEYAGDHITRVASPDF